MSAAEILAWLEDRAIVTAVLAGVVALACRLGRLKPAVRHALWLVVLAKFMMPPGLAWPWQLPTVALSAAGPSNQSEFSGAGPPTAVRASAPPAIVLMTAPDGTLEDVGQANESTPQEKAISYSATSEESWQRPTVGTVILAIWTLGALMAVALQCRQIICFRRLCAQGLRGPSSLTCRVAQLSHALGVRPPAMRVVAAIPSPCIWSLGRPQLILPAHLAQNLRPGAIDTILVHELAHLRRRDHWVAWLLVVARCIWWWDPVLWVVSRQIRWNAELACDGWVVNALPQERRAYAEALIEVSQAVVPVPVSAMGGGPRRFFEERLIMVMRDTMPSKVPVAGLVAIAALALAVLPGWSQQQPPADDDRPATAPAPPAPPAPPSAPVGGDPPQGAPGGGYETQPIPPVPPPPPGLPGTRRYRVQDNRERGDEGRRRDNDGQSDDRDRRLRHVEDQVQMLLRELHEIRAERPGDSLPWRNVIPLPPPPPGEGIRMRRGEPGDGLPRGPRPAPGADPYPQGAPSDDGQPKFKHTQLYVSGIRLADTLPLPKAKAEALTRFAREELGVTVDVKPGSIQIWGGSMQTTTPVSRPGGADAGQHKPPPPPRPPEPPDPEP
jgi:beta-lactamase regulating signal transducer with metallopeptidase domain